jgi:cell division protein FtsQ
MHLFTRKRKVSSRKTAGTKCTAGLDHTRKLLAALCAGIFAVLLVTSGALFVRQSSLFELRELKIFGCNLTRPEDIVSQARIEKGMNLLSVDLNRKSSQLEQYDYIYKAVLERKLPGTLEIYVEERKPLAIIKLDDFYLVDERGEVFKKAVDHEMHYPVLNGLTKDDLYRDSEHSHHLIRAALALVDAIRHDKRFTESGIEIAIDKNTGFTLTMTPEGTTVYIGFGDFAEKFEALWKIVDDLASKGLTPETIHLKSAQKAYVTLKG